MRWFGLACFLILLVLAWRRGELKHYAIALGMGCVVGAIFDVVGVNLGLWSYPEQPYLSLKYWFLVVTCWGVFGATINLLLDWYLWKNWLGIAIMTVFLMLVYEIPNFITDSWEYNAISPLVILGWFPLVMIYRLSYLFVVDKEARKKVLSIWESHVTSKDRVANSN